MAVAVDSLHHWDDQVAGLKQIFRLLKPGGYLLVIDFDPTTGKGHFIRSMERFLLMGSHFFTLPALTSRLAKIGFKTTSLHFIDSGTYFLVAKR